MIKNPKNNHLFFSFSIFELPTAKIHQYGRYRVLFSNFHTNLVYGVFCSPYHLVFAPSHSGRPELHPIPGQYQQKSGIGSSHTRLISKFFNTHTNILISVLDTQVVVYTYIPVQHWYVLCSILPALYSSCSQHLISTLRKPDARTGFPFFLDMQAKRIITTELISDFNL